MVDGSGTGVNRLPVFAKTEKESQMPVSMLNQSSTVSVQSPTGFSPQKALVVNVQSRLLIESVMFRYMRRLVVPQGEVNVACKSPRYVCVIPRSISISSSMPDVERENCRESVLGVTPLVIASRIAEPTVISPVVSVTRGETPPNNFAWVTKASALMRPKP